MADRVLVLSKGKVLHEFQRGKATKGELMHAVAGVAPLERGWQLGKTVDSFRRGRCQSISQPAGVKRGEHERKIG